MIEQCSRQLRHWPHLWLKTLQVTGGVRDGGTWRPGQVSVRRPRLCKGLRESLTLDLDFRIRMYGGGGGGGSNDPRGDRDE